MSYNSSMTKVTRKKNIFVTGGSGFIGEALLAQFSKKTRYEVIALSRTKEKRRIPNVSFVKGDLFRPETYEKDLRESDAVIHLAGEININGSIETPRISIETNSAMLFNILEVLRKSKKKSLVIFTSTDRLYGKTKKRTVSEAEQITPIEPYTASKMICEILLETYSLLYGIPYIILRLDSVYGPRQPRSMFISDIIQKMITQDKILVGKLLLRKNFVYVDDVAEAILAALKTDTSLQNTFYNIGGESVSLKDVCEIAKVHIEKTLKKKISITTDLSLIRPANIEVSPFQLSTKKAQQKLRWETKVSLKSGLIKTINYFLECYE